MAGFQLFVDYGEKISNLRFLEGLLEIQRLTDNFEKCY